MPDVVTWLILFVALFVSPPASAAGGAPLAPSVPLTETCEPGVSGKTDLAQARECRNTGDYERAERILRHALQSNDLTKTERDEIGTELAGVLTTRRLLIELELITRLVHQGHLEDAAKRLIALLPTATDDRVLMRIAKLLAQTETWWRPPLFTVVTWALTAIPFILLAVLLFVVRGLLFIVLNSRSKRWLLAELTDSTNRSAKSMIAHYFLYWLQLKPAPVTSGLLLMEASSIPLSPDFAFEPESYDVARELTSIDLTLGGVSVASLARAFTTIFRWLWPRPMEIHGVAYLDQEKRICARLTAPLPVYNGNKYAAWFTRRGGRIVTVSAAASGDSEDAVRAVAEEVTFKMLYALAKEDIGASADANDLRCGLEKLRAYLSGILPKGGPSLWNRLDEARRLFEGVRKARPDSLEAHIYEGIALDLLERHEDAAAHFEHVERLTKNANEQSKIKLHEQAVYNGAVAHLRNLYALPEIDKAIAQLVGLVGKAPDLEKRPLLALASATMADAWANRTIHWRDVSRTEAGLKGRVADDRRLLAIIRVHERKVLDIIRPVQALLRKFSGAPQVNDEAADGEAHEALWGPDTRRQVEWAIHNALGDFHLYAAVALTKIDVRRSVAFREFFDMRETKEFQQHVKKALVELRECEMLLPAGVETLSNIGTLYLVRGNTGDLPHARQYLQQAIALNAHYEYAYYRLAQSWEREGWRAKVIETLTSFPVPPQIPALTEMFKEYFVEPKFEYTSDDSQRPAPE
jgi:tetratricopeptide (TPR) repeat protein